ncbi:hypothetical protein ACHAWF_008977 [Thalassiosira exigua]
MAPLASFAGRFVGAAFAASAPGSPAVGRAPPSVLPASSSVDAPTSTSVPPSARADELSSRNLERMCRLFRAEPADGVRLTSRGERGLCASGAVAEGDAVLRIPLASCWRDDEPPRWYDCGARNEEGEERDITDFERYHPSAWAGRLAASLLDMELDDAQDIHDDLGLGRELWRSYLLDSSLLRASLPVHWGEEVLATSKCTALEVAADAAFFARAGAVADLAEGMRRALLDEEGEDRLRKECDEDAVDVAMDVEGLQRRCHDALDIVQTRACRVERTCEDGIQWGPPLRILAPVFDLINHGAGSQSNARFGLEGESMCDLRGADLVVRATRDIASGEEVRIDYGESARPAWRCLTSYGFVPEHENASDASEEEGGVAVNVAELWMGGLRFEVDPASVPFELVEVAAAQTLLDGGPAAEDGGRYEGLAGGDGAALTPAVARAIAARADEASFHLITEPELTLDEGYWEDPAVVHAASLAALLRWSQHDVLRAFADNLLDAVGAPPMERFGEEDG